MNHKEFEENSTDTVYPEQPSDLPEPVKEAIRKAQEKVFSKASADFSRIKGLLDD